MTTNSIVLSSTDKRISQKQTYAHYFFVFLPSQCHCINGDFVDYPT